MKEESRYLPVSDGYEMNEEVTDPKDEEEYGQGLANVINGKASHCDGLLMNILLQWLLQPLVSLIVCLITLNADNEPTLTNVNQSL
jgi:hypothetical protein